VLVAGGVEAIWQPDGNHVVAGTGRPNPAGISAETTSAQLLGALPSARKASNQIANPDLTNNIVWKNRSFFYKVIAGKATLCSSNNAADAGGATCNTLVEQTATGQCVNTNAGAPAYWDLGVVGDASTTPGITRLSPSYSILTSTTGYAASNIPSDPLLADPYCNGSREAPEFPSVVVPGNPKTLQVAATADEGNNYITLRYGPLYLAKPTNSSGTTRVAFGDTHLTASSPAINAGTTLSAVTHDIDGDLRGTVASGAYDIGADEVVVQQSADLSIIKTDGVTTVLRGGVLTYTIVVTNNGPSAVTGAVVADTRPTAITAGSWAWTCAPTGVNGCGGTANNGTGNINKTLGTLASGASVTFLATGTVSNTATAGPLTNTATVTAPAAILDSNLANNSATDTDTIIVNAATLTGTSAFGNQQVGVPSTANTFTYTNTGNGTLTLAANPVTVTGGNASSNYVVSSNACTAGLSLAPNATCTFNVVFTPSASGSRNATLTVIDTAGGAPNPTLALTGTGLQAVVGFSGSASLTTNTASRTVKTAVTTITNSGNEALVISSIAITSNNGGTNPGAFSVANPGTGTPACPIGGTGLVAGATCQVTVTYTPPATGALNTINGTLTVTDTGAATATQTRNYTGN